MAWLLAGLPLLLLGLFTPVLMLVVSVPLTVLLVVFGLPLDTGPVAGPAAGAQAGTRAHALVGSRGRARGGGGVRH